MDLVTSPTALRRWSVASLVANMGIIVTGGLVRVTGSGLGCSSWPQCEPGAYLPHPEAGGHAFIEFGNRLLTFVLIAIAIGTALSAWRSRRPDGFADTQARWLSIGLGLGIIAQAVIGGVSVWTNLNPWVVGAHLLPSVALVGASVILVHRTHRIEPVESPQLLRRLISGIFWLGLLVMVLGAVVTGAGPNSGDGGAQRNGLDPALTARIHAASVWGLVAMMLAVLVISRTVPALHRASWWLLATVAFQGVVGYAQYFTGLPPALVSIHMLGTTLFTAALTNLWWRARSADRVQNSSGSTAAAAKTIAR